MIKELFEDLEDVFKPASKEELENRRDTLADMYLKEIHKWIRHDVTVEQIRAVLFAFGMEQRDRPHITSFLMDYFESKPEEDEEE